MAGVSPQHRGGSGATTIGMVVAIVVAVLELGVLIWMFTLQEQLRERADRAELVRSRLAHPGDESTAKRLFPSASAGGKTLVSEMNAGVQLLVQRLTGEQNDTPQAAIVGLDAALQQIASDESVPEEDRSRLSPEFGAVKIIEALHQLYDKEKETLAKVEDESEKANDSLDKAEKVRQKLKEEFDAKVAKLQAKVDELQRGKDQVEQSKTEEAAALAGQVSSLRVQLDQMRQETVKLKRRFRAALAEENELLEQQRVALKELRGPAPLAAQPLAIARKPVGKILRALPGDSLVHINLGREDNVVLGMTFSVYSADERVSMGGRGKASIEVVSVSQRTSECRVVAAPSPDDPILEGDLVGNIVLSRNRGRKPHFCVVGDFDVDFDGQVDVRGREMVQALIERWGGVVVPRVGPMTDYLVVGLEPPGQEIGLLGTIGGKAAASTSVETEHAAAGKTAVDSDTDEDADSDEADADEDEGDSGDEDEADDDDGSDTDDGSDDADSDDPSEGNDPPSVDPTPAPRISSNKEINPTLAPQRRRFRSEAQRYEDALRRAKLFSIPVLTQEQFFNFIGIEGTLSDVRRLQG